jgi:ABC-2 type transport system permease protein
VVGLLAPLAEASRGALPVALSLFPLTAPVVMIMRLTDGSVPLWQLLLSAGLMVVATYLIVRAVAAMFRAQHLLSGQPFSVRRYFGALLGRA